MVSCRILTSETFSCIGVAVINGLLPLSFIQNQEDDCEQSCRFLKHVETVRPGTCPRPAEESEDSEAACVVNCNADPACEGSMKCCDNGCGYTCQTPVHVNIGE